MDTERFERGLKIRKEVLGEERVDRSLNGASSFSRPLQDLVTEYCWGAAWARPGLERRTRSLLNLVMLTALNRSHELELHVHGAVNNGCSADEIREALFQATIYCGMPAGLEAFRIADSVLSSLGKIDPSENGQRDDRP